MIANATYHDLESLRRLLKMHPYRVKLLFEGFSHPVIFFFTNIGQIGQMTISLSLSGGVNTQNCRI